MSIEDTAESIDSAPTPPGRAGRPQGRQRWRRFAAMMVGSAAAAATLVVLTAEGALAANFSISGVPFVVTADKVDGHGFEQFATLDMMPQGSPNAGNTGGAMVLMVAGMGTATINNLCQSIALGGTYIKLTAGTNPNNPVQATALVLDFSDLTADQIQFTNINIGQDASTLKNVSNATGGKYNVTGNIGILGMGADEAVINKLRQTNYATSAGVFTLPNLHMSFSSSGC